MPTTIGSTATAQWQPDWAATGHAVTLTVTRPDGTTESPTVTEDDGTPGRFTAPVAADFAGRYLLRWNDPAPTDRAEVDILDVWPEDPRYLISVDDAMTGLQWGTADRRKSAAAIALYIAAATEVIEDITGAVLIRSITQPADGGRTGVLLWERPSTVTSVTVDGAEHTGWVPNLNAGIVYADGHGGRFPDGVQNVIITYKTGAASVPPSIQLAARELVRHLWQIGQQGPSPDNPPGYGQNQPQMGMTRSGFAVPRRVIELCGNHYALPGMA